MERPGAERCDFRDRQDLVQDYCCSVDLGGSLTHWVALDEGLHDSPAHSAEPGDSRERSAVRDELRRDYQARSADLDDCREHSADLGDWVVH